LIVTAGLRISATAAVSACVADSSAAAPVLLAAGASPLPIAAPAAAALLAQTLERLRVPTTDQVATTPEAPGEIIE